MVKYALKAFEDKTDGKTRAGGKKMSFEGYKRIDFRVNGRDSVIICPEKPIEGNPWIWKTEFFEAFNYAERALLERGFHLAYHKVSDLYGCPESVEMMKEFYDAATGEYGLNKKTALFGFSRGGLYAFNFALKYPGCAAAVYLDAPVLDVYSWPGGFGHGEGHPQCWEQCKKIYGTDEGRADFKGNPLDHAEEFAALGIPTLLICGAVDRVVPYDENGELFYNKMKAAGGKIEQIVKPDCDHHPHSLHEPEPICDFVYGAYGLK